MSIQSLQRQSGNILEQTTYQGKEKRSVQNTKMPEVVEQCCLVQPCFCEYHECYHLVINTPAGGAWSEMSLYCTSG